MASLLIIVIYFAFISLGLPDSLFGSAWPAMYGGFGVPVSYAGIISIIGVGGTIVSSLVSAKVIRRYGTGIVTTLSVALTAVAIFGYSISKSFWMMCLFSIPYGLGAGTVDVALNNFVALHYKSRHINWLHCFWGIGATAGPYIMGMFLMGGRTWNAGYQAIGFIQTALVAGLIVTLPLWRKANDGPAEPEVKGVSFGFRKGLRLPGAVPLFSAFFCYCAVEGTAGFWASSYMVLNRGISPDLAAKMASLFYLGITGGRFLSGFISIKLDNRRMVQVGEAIATFGILLLFLPLGNTMLYVGLTLIGLGFAPIYPSLLHETPVNFGRENSELLMGMQMASAYTGATILPPLFGVIAQKFSIGLYPVYMLVLVVAMIWLTEYSNRVFKNIKAAKAIAAQSVSEV